MKFHRWSDAQQGDIPVTRFPEVVPELSLKREMWKKVGYRGSYCAPDKEMPRTWMPQACAFPKPACKFWYVCVQRLQQFQENPNEKVHLK